MSNARLLQRTDVPPLPEDAPVDEIAQWLAREIEEVGDLTHLTAVFSMRFKFGSQFHIPRTDLQSARRAAPR
jgi:hypothetical protein